MTKQMLNVPFVSRYTAGGARLDCGACCVAMLLEAMAQPASPVEIAAGRAGCQLSPTALIRGAEASGLTMFRSKGRMLDDLKRLIDDGQVPIVRIKYSAISDRLERRLTGAHYVVVVGYDDQAGQVFINDPHYPEAGEDANGGYRRAYSYETFLDAWAGFDFSVLTPVPAAAPAPPVEDVAALSFSFAAGQGDVWVVAPLGLLVRAQADVPAAPGVPGIPFGQRLTALGPESAPDAKGLTWRQVRTDYGLTGWVAASAGGNRYLSKTPPVEPYTVYVLDTAPVRQAGGLSLRDGRGINAPLKESVPIGGALVVYQRVTEVDGTPWLWVKSPGGVFGWVRERADNVVMVSQTVSEIISPATEEVTTPITSADWYGLNINPSPQGAHRPLTTAELQQGVGWVRFVFKQSALRDLTEAQSLAHYDNVVEYHRAAGTKSLMILNWESFWGHGPWDHGDWARYANDFGAYVRKVAQHFKGRVPAYQIWNEGDNPEGHGTSIHVPPQTYAPLLLAAGRAIREVDPAAKIVFGGVCGSAENNVNYVRQTRAAMQGEWPVDAVGMHPYGQYPVNIRTEVPHLARFGWLQDYLNTVTRGLPDPIWITEIGVPSDDENWADTGIQHWEAIARYLQEVYAEVAQRYRDRVPVIFWFAWSNKMRGSGIVDTRDQARGPIYDAFFNVVRGAA